MVCTEYHHPQQSVTQYCIHRALLQFQISTAIGVVSSLVYRITEIQDDSAYKVTRFTVFSFQIMNQEKMFVVYLGQ
jgi:type III secretory pathway component EscS